MKKILIRNKYVFEIEQVHETYEMLDSHYTDCLHLVGTCRELYDRVTTIVITKKSAKRIYV